MDRFFRETKGAISIFLVIVLLPMMTVASVFVDMSRIKLANSMAESAGDLTLNTALTNYDAELKNLYGLFATAQDMNELMEELEDYYRDSIVAAGVSEAAADDYVGQIMSYLSTSTGTDDIMNIEVSGFEVSVPSGGNLNNPAVLKSQIVEFMKYRAPLELGSGFLDALSTMKDLSKQTKLVEDKNEFYEQHQSLLSTLESAWWQIQLYQYASAKSNTGFPTGSYLTDQETTMEINADRWSNDEIVDKTVKYLYRWNDFKSLLTGTSQLQYEIKLQYICSDCGHECSDTATQCSSCKKELVKDLDHQQWKLTWQGSTQVVKPIYTKDEPATADNVLEWLNAVLNAIKVVDSYTTGNNSKAYQAVMIPNTASEVERIYAVCIFNEELSKSNHYLKSVKTLLECLINLKAAVDTCDAEDLSEMKVIKVSDGTYQVETSAGGTPIKSFVSGNLSHLSMSNGGYMDMFNKVVSMVNGHYMATQDTFEQAKTDVTTKIDLIRDHAVAFDNMLEGKIENLTKAIELMNKVKSAISDTNSEYYKALSDWKTSANNLSGNSMGKNDLKEIEDVTSIITVSNVDGLLKRLNGAKTTLETLRSEIAKYKFAGTPFKDIQDDINIRSVKQMLSSWNTEITEIVPKNEQAYDAVIAKIEGSVMRGNLSNTWGETEKSPDLTDTQHTLYTWMHNNFYQEVSDYSTATKPNQTASADGDIENMENSLQSKADGTNCEKDVNAGTEVLDRDISKYLDESLKALPSTRWETIKADIVSGKIDTNADSLLEATNKKGDNILETILTIASDFGTDLRDNLYVAEYIMSMFSYDTIEAETYVKESGKSMSVTEGLSFYEKPDKSDGEYVVKTDYAEYAKKIQTLTNNSINPNMNYLYGSEVEYIVYGENGKADVYGTIFVMRFAMNTVYAFMDAEINNATLAAATALFGTPPLTPLIPFAKAAMTIGLAIAESGWDLAELRKGEAVPLMKNSNTWVMKPSGIASEVKDAVKNEVQAAANAVIDKGYKILNDAIQMTSDELQKLIDEGEDGLEKLTTATIETVTDQFKNYANQALNEVVELCNSVNQKAMMQVDYVKGATEDKVTQVMSGLDAWLNDQTGDEPAIYEVKQAAVNYLKSNGGEQITKILDSLGTQTSSNEYAKELEALLNNIRSEINGKVDALINEAGSALHGMVDGLQKDLEDAAKKGAESLKKALSDQLDNAFGAIPESGSQTSASTNAMASLLSWRYSDYLRIFVVIGLFANEETMLLRIGDLIELNMQKKNNEYAVITTTETVTTSRFFGLWKTTKEKSVSVRNENSFTLEKSYTYLQINATLKVKPLMMTLPFMADTVENQLTGTNWYEITYSGILGY